MPHLPIPGYATEKHLLIDSFGNSIYVMVVLFWFFSTGCMHGNIFYFYEHNIETLLLCCYFLF